MTTLLVLLALLVGGSAGAQSLNYQTFLLGDRPLGLGGAFTGLADDPAAIYYNPAGIARLGLVSASGSLSVSLFEDYVVEDGFGTPIGTDDLRHSGAPSVPLFVGLVYKPGSRRTEATARRHAFGASIIHPGFLQRSYEAVVSEAATGESASLDVETSDRQSWYGVSYAYRVSAEWSFGASVFLAFRDFRHEEIEVGVRVSDASVGATTSSFSARQSVTSIESTHFVGRVGVLWDVDGRWRVGLMLQPPGVMLGGGSRVRERISRVDVTGATPVATFVSSTQDNLETELPIPWELRLGASVLLRPELVLAFDVSVYGPAGSGDEPLTLVGAPGADGETGFVPSPGLLVAQHAYSKVVVNGSVGAEALLGDRFVLRGGLFTDLSPYPDAAGSRESYRPPDVDYVGASLSLGLRSGEYDISIGAAGLLGWGDAYRVNSVAAADEGQPLYLTADVRANAVYFYLSGALAAASRFAGTATDDMFE